MKINRVNLTKSSKIRAIVGDKNNGLLFTNKQSVKTNQQ